MTTQWVWQDQNWPNFIYDRELFVELEQQFIQNSGFIFGAQQHISVTEQNQLTIDLASEEAITSSAIEGEILNRESVRASLLKYFGLITHDVKVPALEQGISFIIQDIYHNFAAPLTHDSLCSWHLHLTSNRLDLNSVGYYRRHTEPMQIISGSGNKPKVYYEAPSSNIIPQEMDRYIAWYNHNNLTVLVKAGIAHAYFELIHPFEDGNGRIGRAIIEKTIALYFKRPVLLSLSKIIQKQKKEYYAALSTCNRKLDITEWLIYFCNTMLTAQQYTKEHINFIIAKRKLYDKLKNQLNFRQNKVLSRIFREGIDGFTGGLSAENYIAITKTSRATATRDLQELVTLGAFYKVGELKGTRYYLKIK